ncbi:hypothetical protein NHX12_018289 [Muraenolepis orangiensis]|uniref:GP-PDE domain-containing protein n=1 Tax=Muraenolepis orangiensis TaxID=630683 RepID=A0A9Q0EZL3_9TELE|nr:hypothetical protein NHX12_018289 [Muraenolepis orangiensis]
MARKRPLRKTPGEEAPEKEAPEVTFQSKNGNLLWYSSTQDRGGRARVENIVRMTPGPTRYATSRVDDIKSSFQLFLPESIVEIIMEMTNLEGRRVFADTWKALDQPKKNKNVSLMSTLHKDAAVRTAEHRKPHIILDYNRNKGGVDCLDKAAVALGDLYRKHPVLYNSSIVCSFEPKVIYRMRQTDPEVVTALTHRPWSMSRRGDGTPHFASPWKHQWMTLLDILLDWAHHHLLWKLCGISAFLIQKDFVSPDYVQYWAKRGVQVVAWTVNKDVEKQYYQEVLQVNYITDSLVEDCEPHY